MEVSVERYQRKKYVNQENSPVLYYIRQKAGTAKVVDIDALDDSGIDPYKDVLSVAEFRRHFGTPLHPFTGVDYISYCTQRIEEEGAEAELELLRAAAPGRYD